MAKGVIDPLLTLKRCMAGALLMCATLTIVGSILAGARIITVTYRVAAVTIILWAVYHILIRRLWFLASHRAPKAPKTPKRSS